MAEYLHLARTIATQCAGLRIRQASRLLTRTYDECLRPLGIQETQLAVLVAVAMFGEDGVRMRSLANKLVMDPTTLTRNVVPLETKGLLRVARSPEDARARIIFLTPAGERLIESAYPMWEQAQARLRSTLGDERFDGLRSRLADVISFADKLEDDRAE